MSRRTWLRAAITAGLAMIMVSGFPATAEADSADTMVPATGNLVIHKYVGDPVPGAETNGVAIDTSGWAGVTPAAGVVFDLHKVGPPVDSAAYPVVPPQGTYVRNDVTGQLDVFEGTTLIGQYHLDEAATPTVETGAGGTATAAGLPQGVYLVRENFGRSSITNAVTGEAMYTSQVAAPFLVAVPMTAPDGSGWLDTVHVYPKNEAMTITKTVDKTGAVMVGDKVTYTITTSVPSTVAGASVYQIWDWIHPALNPVWSSVAVSTVPALTGDYALGKRDMTLSGFIGSNLIHVVISEASLGKLAHASSVVITFDAYVNARMLDAPGLVVPNTARFEYCDPSNTWYEANSDGSSTIQSAAIRVTTVDPADQALSGASFKIASTQGNAKTGNFLRLDPNTKVLYDYDPAPTSDWTRLGAGNDYRIQPDHEASFVGLRDRADVGGTLVWQTYWVVETAAPAGYNFLADPIEVSFEAAFKQLDDPADYGRVAVLTVTKSKGFILPVTGGAGTIGLTVAGVVLIGLAVLLAVTRKKAETV